MTLLQLHHFLSRIMSQISIDPREATAIQLGDTIVRLEELVTTYAAVLDQAKAQLESLDISPERMAELRTAVVNSTTPGQVARELGSHIASDLSLHQASRRRYGEQWEHCLVNDVGAGRFERLQGSIALCKAIEDNVRDGICAEALSTSQEAAIATRLAEFRLQNEQHVRTVVRQTMHEAIAELSSDFHNMMLSHVNTTIASNTSQENWNN